ncbi:MAG: hypothetical protein DCC74_09010 [Proteobacteria bacterium]|nr:MAG: hypothetical protein DCC74_09010 [Pseudomonadota bacterium]
MSILDDLATDVGAALSGVLRAGTLYRETPGGDDGYGNQLPGTWAPHAFEGLRGSFNSVLAGLSGIPRTDAKIEILASSCAIAPQRLDKISIEGEWWIITEIEVDPAGCWFICQCANTGALP